MNKVESYEFQLRWSAAYKFTLDFHEKCRGLVYKRLTMTLLKLYPGIYRICCPNGASGGASEIVSSNFSSGSGSVDVTAATTTKEFLRRGSHVRIAFEGMWHDAFVQRVQGYVFDVENPIFSYHLVDLNFTGKLRDGCYRLLDIDRNIHDVRCSCAWFVVRSETSWMDEVDCMDIRKLI